MIRMFVLWSKTKVEVYADTERKLNKHGISFGKVGNWMHKRKNLDLLETA